MNTDLADSCTDRSELGDRTYCTASRLLSAPLIVMASGRTDPDPLVPVGVRVGEAPRGAVPTAVGDGVNFRVGVGVGDGVRAAANVTCFSFE